MKRLGVMAALAVLVVTGCGKSTFTASGVLGIVAVDGAESDCSAGTGGYSDIHKGASVVVYDAAGKKLALGSLGAGKSAGDEGLCVWKFSVNDVPSGKGPYGVEVASRGQVAFTEKQADSIELSLGG